MKGKVINFNQEKSFGFILGENGQNYFFHTSDVNLPFEVSKNKMLTFNPSSNQKGLCAKNVVLEKGKQYNNNHNQQKQSKPKKKKFILIGDITINLFDVKNAKVSGSERFAILTIQTYQSGILKLHYRFSGYASDNQIIEHGKTYNSYIAIDKAREDLKILLNAL